MPLPGAEKATVPLKPFLIGYPLEELEQYLPRDSSYAWKGSDANGFYIEYPFAERCHIVRLPKSDEAGEIAGLVEGLVVLKKDTSIQFQQGYYLLNPQQQYPVTGETATEWELEYILCGRTVTFKADKAQFRLLETKSRLLTSKSGASGADSSRYIDYAGKLAAYRDSHPPPPVRAYSAINEVVVFIKGNDGAFGTGFFCLLDQRVYCVTNHHVIQKFRGYRIEDINGRTYTPLFYEVSADRDLARVLLEESPPAITAIREPKLNESISVLGASDGSEVITFLKGKVIGIGNEKVEVSAEIVRGNSGSPILSAEGEVIGVAGLVSRDFQESSVPDWVKENTRFSKPRRYGLRLDNQTEWLAIEPAALASQAAIYVNHVAYQKELMALFSSIKDPTSLILTLKSSDLLAWCKSFLALKEEYRSRVRLRVTNGKLDFNQPWYKEYRGKLNEAFRNLETIINNRYSVFQRSTLSHQAGYFKQQREGILLTYKSVLEGFETGLNRMEAE